MQADLPPAAACVAGIDVGGTSLRVALADETGTILARWGGSTVGVRTPESVIRMMCEGVRKTLSQAGISAAALKAVGAGVPGITDTENGMVIATSYLMGWRNVPLRSCLEQELNVPAAVDNDVNLAAVGESWLGAAQQSRDFVFMAIGTGVGAGIVLDGHLYRGSCWAAGEVGYMLLPGTAVIPARSDEPGALESLLGGEGIRAQWEQRWCAEKTQLPKTLSATEIFDHAGDGEPLARAILCESATLLAYAIYDITRILNCPLFVLGGSVGLHPALGEATRAILEKWKLRQGPRVMQSALGADAQLLGAIRAALDVAGVRSQSVVSPAK
jgi:glucokinase